MKKNKQELRVNDTFNLLIHLLPHADREKMQNKNAKYSQHKQSTVIVQNNIVTVKSLIIEKNETVGVVVKCNDGSTLKVKLSTLKDEIELTSKQIFMHISAKRDLINIICGIEKPNHEALLNDMVHDFGEFIGDMDNSWRWLRKDLEKLNEQQLIDLYNICK